MSKSNPKIVQFTFRPSKEVHEAIKKLAKENDRSINYIVEYACERLIEDEKS